MTRRTAEHGTIRLERRYNAAPSRVFAAWAQPAARTRWDVPGRWVIAEQSFDFREGGRERKRFGPKDDPRFVAETLYLDIVPDRRIVYSYAMTARGVPISVSLTTVELAPDGIRVNAINPVIGETGLTAEFMGGTDTPELRKKFIASIPLGRMSTPADVANAALYLASDEAALVTGACLDVDGGRSV